MRTRMRKLWHLARPLVVPTLLAVLAALMLWRPLEWWLQGQENYDREALQAWVREATVFERLPDLVASYLKLRDDQKDLEAKLQAATDKKVKWQLGMKLENFKNQVLENKRREILVHLKALGEPATKTYAGRLV